MNTQVITTPSLGSITIREATGKDDDILSNVHLDEAGVVNKYLSNLIIKDAKGKKLDEDAVERMPLRDKYTILIKSRIFSLGKNLLFEYDWEDGKPPQQYDVDLTEYVWEDYSEFPGIEDEGYFQERIGPYQIETLEAKLGDKELRMEFLNGVGERYLLELPENQRTINKQLVARNLEMHTGDTWEKVANFGAFSSREMVTLRALYEKYDKDLMGLVSINNPQTGQTEELSLIGIKDFYFPVRIS